MKQQEHKITFQPSGQHVFALPDTVLLEAADRVGLVVQTPCGGAGICGKCKVRVTCGKCEPSKACLNVLSEKEVADGYRLACHAVIRDELVIEIPQSSLFETQQQIITSDSGGDLEIKPAIKKTYLELPVPNQEDAISDLERIRSALAPNAFNHVSIHTLRFLPSALRAASYNGTAVVVDRELVDFEPGDTTGKCYGVAFDLGTTTIAGTLVDLPSGAGLAVEATVNPQTSFGDDVISRIQKCRDDQKNLANLQRIVADALNGLIGTLLKKSGVPMSSVYEIVIAGNTTMQQIVCGINPSALGELPFVPVFTHALQMRASDLGLRIHQNGRVYVFPQIGGFVGGDTVAGILACRLDRMTGTTLFVDVGTNGEIVLSHEGRLTATSVAAGPAFEGARISCGMRATRGAIEKAFITDDVNINVIGNVKPSGLCGSGLIDIVSELLRTGLVDSSGRVVEPDETPQGTPKAIRERIVKNEGCYDFILVHPSESASGERLVISQKDIRELQLANAAIRAGINILLQMEGVQASDLNQILVAGGFGNFIRRNHAKRIGLLPQVPNERICFIGNASSLGAKRSLLSIAEKEYADAIVRKTQHLDLSLSPDFQMEFGAAMMFPESID